MRARFLVLVIVLGLMNAPALGNSIDAFSEIADFDNLFGPFDEFLFFRTNKTGTDSFDFSGAFKDRPGDYFSDEVTFSSPDYFAPEQVLWGHFDGPDGGIAPRPSFSGKLRLDFRVPVNAVGFRNPGIQPGINVLYFGLNGELLGAVLGSASSFVGAASTTPIVHLIVEGAGGQGYAITALRFNQVSVPEPVPVDIKPHSDSNSINCNNDQKAITVAILTTEDFDATTVDDTTVTFEGAIERHVNKKSEEPTRHEKDVDHDGDTDLEFHFRLGDTDLTCESTQGTLTGETFDGIPIEGTDSVNMVGGTTVITVGQPIP